MKHFPKQRLATISAFHLCHVCVMKHKTLAAASGFSFSFLLFFIIVLLGGSTLEDLQKFWFIAYFVTLASILNQAPYLCFQIT
jgi:hypothetical protein